MNRDQEPTVERTASIIQAKPGYRVILATENSDGSTNFEPHFEVIAWYVVVNNDIISSCPVTAERAIVIEGYEILMHPDGKISDINGDFDSLDEYRDFMRKWID